MSSNFKFLLLILILSLPFWWGMNSLEKDLRDFFFWHQISKAPQLIPHIFTAQLDEKLEALKPIRDRKIGDLDLKVKSAISVLVDDKGLEKILFKKEEDIELPIASLTKMMTAWVVLNHYNLSKEITISKKALDKKYGENGKLQEGKTFKAEYFLYPLLMESSNSAAIALSNDYEGINQEKFIALMNEEAEKIGMNSTFFDNPTGLDPEESGTKLNYSNSKDLAKLAKVLLKNPLIPEILSLKSYSLYGPELVNTNKLLIDENISWQERIIGGKTGFTEKSGGVLLLALKAPKNKGTIINVVLGAKDVDDRFEEMKRLVSWLKEAYQW